MALPLILSLLGSGLAGAGALGGLGILGSPLIAGAIGSGLGTAIQEKDLGAGIRVRSNRRALGGLGGALVGGGAGLLTNPATATAGSTVGNVAANEAANRTSRDDVSYAIWLFWSYGPDGVQQVYGCPRNFGGDGIPVPRCYARRSQPRRPHRCWYRRCASRCYAGHDANHARYEEPKKPRPEPVPFNRQRAGPPGSAPALSGSAVLRQYKFRCLPAFAGGGMLSYTPAGMDQPMRMQAGGIADMMPGAEREAAPMNDKDIVAESIRAIRGELPEQEAAIVLGQFLQTYGEEAFRKLVDDVQSGRAGAGGDMEGTVQGPGDGMDDLVPATMDDGSQDVLLSDGEFIVPADVVSGLGNGSTDAGAEELHRMMDRVRQERTGRTEQAPKVAAGGLMPA
jgi:hypothetical protein